MPPQQISSRDFAKKASFFSYLNRLTKKTLREEFQTMDEAAQYLLIHAKNLVAEQVYPRFSIEPYLDSLISVLPFIKKYQERFSEVNIGPELCEAIEHFMVEFQILPQSRLQGKSVVPEKGEISSTTALLLQAYQEAIYQVTDDSMASAVRASFGVHEIPDPKNVPKLIRVIDHFLKGAKRYPLYLRKASISQAQLNGLQAQRNVLQAFTKEGDLVYVAPFQRARLLHVAIEHFFECFAGALHTQFLDLPEVRMQGLKLLPRF